MSEKKGNGSSRRTFLFGLLTGAGAAAVASVAMSPKSSRSSRGQAPTSKSSQTPAEPVLYQRTAEAERYYKTLYL